MELAYRCGTVNAISSQSVSGSAQESQRRGRNPYPAWRWRSAAMTSPMSLIPDAPVPAMFVAGRLFNLGLLELSRQEALDDGDLVTFSLREVGRLPWS